jgi:uncharacterized protein YbcI
MQSPIPTRGQLERELSQRLQSLYRDQLGHQPGKITCQLQDTQLTIIIEDSVTQPEKLLVDDGREQLAEQVRADLDQAIRPHVTTLVEDVLKVPVSDLLSDATLKTGNSGIIVILEKSPETRIPASKRRLPQRSAADDPRDQTRSELSLNQINTADG